MFNKIERNMRYFVIGLAVDLYNIVWAMVDTINEVCVYAGIFSDNFYCSNIYTLNKNKQIFCQYMKDRI